MENNNAMLGVCESFQDSLESLIPYNQINEKEFDIILNKLGGFLYLTTNKNMTPTNLFLTILSDTNMQKIALNFTTSPTLLPILKGILVRHPNLIKSKMLKTKAIKINKILKKKKINVT